MDEELDIFEGERVHYWGSVVLKLAVILMLSS